MDTAKSMAGSQDVPYGIFFCSEDMAKYAGEGSSGAAEYAKATKRRVTPTCFEYPLVITALKSQSIPVSKVVITKESMDLCRKYRVAADPTFVLCAADGQPMAQLAGPQCTAANMAALLKGLKQQYQLWKQANPQKSAPAK